MRRKLNNFTEGNVSFGVSREVIVNFVNKALPNALAVVKANAVYYFLLNYAIGSISKVQKGDASGYLNAINNLAQTLKFTENCFNDSSGNVNRTNPEYNNFIFKGDAFIKANPSIAATLKITASLKINLTNANMSVAYDKLIESLAKKNVFGTFAERLFRATKRKVDGSVRGIISNIVKTIIPQLISGKLSPADLEKDLFSFTDGFQKLKPFAESIDYLSSLTGSNFGEKIIAGTDFESFSDLISNEISSSQKDIAEFLFEGLFKLFTHESSDYLAGLSEFSVELKNSGLLDNQQLTDFMKMIEDNGSGNKELALAVGELLDSLDFEVTPSFTERVEVHFAEIEAQSKAILATSGNVVVNTFVADLLNIVNNDTQILAENAYSSTLVKEISFKPIENLLETIAKKISSLGDLYSSFGDEVRLDQATKLALSGFLGVSGETADDMLITAFIKDAYALCAKNIITLLVEKRELVASSEDGHRSAQSLITALIEEVEDETGLKLDVDAKGRVDLKGFINKLKEKSSGATPPEKKHLIVAAIILLAALLGTAGWKNKDEIAAVADSAIDGIKDIIDKLLRLFNDRVKEYSEQIDQHALAGNEKRDNHKLAGDSLQAKIDGALERITNIELIEEDARTKANDKGDSLLTAEDKDVVTDYGNKKQLELGEAARNLAGEDVLLNLQDTVNAFDAKDTAQSIPDINGIVEDGYGRIDELKETVDGPLEDESSEIELDITETKGAIGEAGKEGNKEIARKLIAAGRLIEAGEYIKDNELETDALLLSELESAIGDIKQLLKDDMKIIFANVLVEMSGDSAGSKTIDDENYLVKKASSNRERSLLDTAVEDLNNRFAETLKELSRELLSDELDIRDAYVSALNSLGGDPAAEARNYYNQQLRRVKEMLADFSPSGEGTAAGVAANDLLTKVEDIVTNANRRLSGMESSLRLKQGAYVGELNNVLAKTGQYLLEQFDAEIESMAKVTATEVDKGLADVVGELGTIYAKYSKIGIDIKGEILDFPYHSLEEIRDYWWDLEIKEGAIDTYFTGLGS